MSCLLGLWHRTILTGYVDFTATLHHEIGLARSFCSHKKNSLQTRIDAVSERYNIKLGSTETQTFLGVAKLELEDLRDSLTDIAHQLVQLEWFWRVNDEAANLIIDKAACVYSQDTLREASLALAAVDVTSPCKSRLALVNTTIEAVRHALADKNGQRHRSLILERFIKSSRRAAYTDMLLAVHADDEAALYPLLEDASSSGMPVLRAFMQIAIVHRSFRCQQLLLPFIASHVHAPVSEKHDYLQRIVRRLGKTSSSDKAILEFRDIVDALTPHQSQFIDSLDSRGRLPLHHAAELGLDGVCREIWAHTKAWKKFSIGTRDKAGETVLEIAVRAGHDEVVATLLQNLDSTVLERKLGGSALLSTSILARHEEISRMLISRRVGLGHVMRNGRTVAHLAAEVGLPSVVQALADAQVVMETPEPSRGRTPLMLAAILGHHETAKCLVDNGVSVSPLDVYKWSAKDHAAYRGFTKLAGLLGDPQPRPLLSKSHKRRGVRNILPRCSSRETSSVFVTPGATDLFKDTPFVNLAQLRKKLAPMQIPETSLWIAISAIGCEGETFKARLPILEDYSDSPWIFKSDDPENVKLVFKLHSQFQKAPVGTAVALLSSLKQGLGPNRESLVRDYTLPFIDAEADFVGEVTFTFLISTPCEGSLPVAYDQELKTPALAEVGGHRGEPHKNQNYLLV